MRWKILQYLIQVFFDNDQGIYLIASSNNDIFRNNIHDNEFRGIRIRSSSNNLIRFNSITNHDEPYGQGIELSRSNNNLMEHNDINSNDIGIDIGGILGNQGGDGIGNIIRNSDISNNERWGVYFRDTRDNQIIDTTIQNNGIDFFRYPFSFEEGCNNILDNVIGTNDRPILYFNERVNLHGLNPSELILCNADGSIIDGISINNGEERNNGVYLFMTDNAILSNLDIENTKDGIYLGNSNHNIIQNSFSANNDYGIYLYGSYWNDIHENYLIENEENGLMVAYSEGNMVTNNFFNNNQNSGIINDNIDIPNLWNIQNIIQLRNRRNIFGGINFGGNYWATPNGNGFSQICNDFNRNGICDEGYQLDENNVDEFPLTIIGNNVPILTY